MTELEVVHVIGVIQIEPSRFRERAPERPDIEARKWITMVTWGHFWPPLLLRGQKTKGDISGGDSKYQ